MTGRSAIDRERGADEGSVDFERVRGIVDKVLGGDRDAFRTLVERESISVRRTCFRVLGNEADAEDAAQETFVTAYRALGTWRREGPFGAWMGRIAVRVALRHARRRRTRKELAWSEPPGLVPLAASTNDPEPVARASASTLESQQDPARVLLQMERNAAVRAALIALEDPYRETLAMRFLADMSLAEIAAESGRPLPTIKTHLRRGLLRLRERLETDR